jgi:hypothetical protein
MIAKINLTFFFAYVPIDRIDSHFGYKTNKKKKKKTPKGKSTGLECSLCPHELIMATCKWARFQLREEEGTSL